MATKKEETTSFVLRFTQKIYQTEADEAQVQWRGSIRHVQSGEESRFSTFEEATTFVQSKLTDFTIKAVEDKSPDEQKGILSKSFDLWKKVASNTPKMVMESLKDPKKQVAQIQEQISQVGDNIGQRIEDALGQRIEMDEWRGVSKSDYKNLVQMLEHIALELESLKKEVKKNTKPTTAKKAKP